MTWRTKLARMLAGLGALVTSWSTLPPPAPASADVRAPARYTAPQRPPIVMLLFDELPLASLLDPHGKIDEHSFPSFHRLAERSIWYRNATSERGFSKEAIPGILSGEYPAEQLDGPNVVPHNLFSVLDDAYTIVADEELPGLCPTQCATLTPSPMGTGTRVLHGFANSDNGRRFTSWLHAIEPDADARFFFLHLVTPHSPWLYLPSGQRYTDHADVPGEINPPGRGEAWTDDPWLVKQAYARHLLQTQLADKILGLLLQRMEEARILDGSLLVVAADHGVAFVPGLAKRLISGETIGHVAPVPLFIKLPHQRWGVVSDSPARTADLLPTITDALGMPGVPVPVGSRSLLTPPIPPRVRVASGVTFDELGREKYAVAARKHTIFARQGGAVDPFALVPSGTRRLIGRHVRTLSWVEGDAHASVPALAELDDVRLDGTFVPALVEGTIEGEAPRTIVIALNGRVVAVTRSYAKGAETHFASLVSPASLREGSNELAVFALRRWRSTMLMRLPVRE